MKKYICILLLVFVGCKSDGDEPSPVVPGNEENVQIAMTFGAQAVEESRGAQAVEESRGAQAAEESRGAAEIAATLGNKFAVAAWKTKSQSSTEFVMSKDPQGNSPYIVDYSSSLGWQYTTPTDQYLKYWDLSAQDYTFYAIANYPVTLAFGNGYAKIAGVSASDTEARKLMESHYMRVGPAAAPKDYDLLGNPSTIFYSPTSNGQIPAYADIVPLPFHYLLSQVQFKIYNKAASAETVVAINHVTIDIKDGGGFYKTGDYQNLEFINLRDKATEFIDTDMPSVIIQGTKASANLLCHAYVLPQALGISAEVKISTDKGTFYGTVNLSPGWEKGTVYTYYLILNHTDKIILVDTVEIDPWTPYEKPIENTQTNW